MPRPRTWTPITPEREAQLAREKRTNRWIAIAIAAPFAAIVIVALVTGLVRGTLGGDDSGASARRSYASELSGIFGDEGSARTEGSGDRDLVLPDGPCHRLGLARTYARSYDVREKRFSSVRCEHGDAVDVEPLR